MIQFTAPLDYLSQMTDQLINCSLRTLQHCSALWLSLSFTFRTLLLSIAAFAFPCFF